MGQQTTFEHNEWEAYQHKSISEQARDENYKKLQNDECHLCKTQECVLKALQNNPEGLCDKEISKKTGLPISSVCGRRNELVKMGLIQPDGTIEYPDYKNSMRMVTRWRLSV